MKSKHWWMAGAGLVTLVVVGKASGLLSLSKEIEIQTNAQVYKVNLTGFELWVYVTIKNPTSSQVSISFPFVKIIYQQQVLENGVKKIKENTLTSSQIVDKTVLIKANKEIKLPEPIKLKVNWLTLGMNVPSALKEYRANGRVNLLVRTRSEVLSLKKEIIQEQVTTIGNGEEKA